jgi:hypothetical protein
MSSIKFWSRSLSRVGIDQRSREALLQLERMERLFISSASETALAPAAPFSSQHWRIRLEATKGSR